MSLILTRYSASFIVGWGVIILASTQSLMCQTKEGLLVECRLCGSFDQEINSKWNCEGYKGAFDAALSG